MKNSIKALREKYRRKGSYFSECDRDEAGHCAPKDGGAGASAAPSRPGRGKGKGKGKYKDYERLASTMATLGIEDLDDGYAALEEATGSDKSKYRRILDLMTKLGVTTADEAAVGMEESEDNPDR